MWTVCKDCHSCVRSSSFNWLITCNNGYYLTACRITQLTKYGWLRRIARLKELWFDRNFDVRLEYSFTFTWFEVDTKLLQVYFRTVPDINGFLWKHLPAFKWKQCWPWPTPRCLPAILVYQKEYYSGSGLRMYRDTLYVYSDLAWRFLFLMYE